MPFHVFESRANGILSRVSGFLAEAGFTHSLTPARNCTFGCSYCYVPTMRVQGGLKPDDWRHWGEFTTFKGNAAELARRELRPDQTIYCSPLTDPYQPAEAERKAMPELLAAVAEHPPRAFVIQTRGTLILRDIDILRRVAEHTSLRVSFSVTTNRDDVRRVLESRCAPIPERWEAVRLLRDAGISVSVALAPILPCDPEELAAEAIECSNGPLVADPFHVRSIKRSGATTREAAIAICEKRGWSEWLEPEFQREVIARMADLAKSARREFGVGPRGFGLLAATNGPSTAAPHTPPARSVDRS